MNGKKTYAVAVLMILHALSAYALGHDQSLNIQEILAAFGLSALRAGVKKAEPPESLPPGLGSILLLCALCVLSGSPARAAADVSSGFRVPSSELSSVESVLASREPGVWGGRLVGSLAPPQQPGTRNPELGTAQANPELP